MAPPPEKKSERPLKGQVVLVTGGGRGLGRQCALTAAEAGAAVSVVATTEEEIRGVAAECRLLGVSAVAPRADVTCLDDTRRMVEETLSALGGLDVLINAAGVDAPRGPFQNVDPSLWDRAFDVNVKGVFLACRAVIPEMLKRGKGHIINISSHLALRGAPGIIAYSATKWAVEGITRGLAAELQDRGIRVHSLSPGRVDTKNFPASLLPPDRWKEFRPPEAIRGSLLFLLTDPDATQSGAFLNAPDWDREHGIEWKSPLLDP